MRAYQKETVIALRSLGEEVCEEWNVAKHSQDDLTRAQYCPRLDIAVGPFNIDRKVDHNIQAINSAYNEHKGFLDDLKSKAAYCGKGFGANANPRCFMAVEIENRTTRKHRLGSILNASALGKVGIVVGWDEKVTESLVRIQGYMDFLWRHQKIAVQLQNAMIIDRSRFL
jgi:hypothetical protein